LISFINLFFIKFWFVQPTGLVMTVCKAALLSIYIYIYMENQFYSKCSYSHVQNPLTTGEAKIPEC
jgi:hypothetical protein